MKVRENKEGKLGKNLLVAALTVIYIWPFTIFLGVSSD
jgi:hypothetical protein